MSDFPHAPKSECDQMISMLPRFLDKDLTMEESAWLQEHAESCAECRVMVARSKEVDSELIRWGQYVASQNPPSAPGEGLAATRRSRSDRRRILRWIPVAATGIAAALALAIIAPQRKVPPPKREPASFVGIPYLPSLDPRENATIVRMNIPVGRLIAMGYRVTADPDGVVPAEVLVGEDGRAHAVRVLSDINLERIGD